MMQRLLFAFLLLCALALRVHAAEISFPQLTSRVVDGANIIDPNTEVHLTAKLAQLEEKTARQLVVVTVPSLGGREIEDYGYQLGRRWGLGEKDKDTGALLIVAPNERRVRIEVGYGLEGILTDAVSRLIIENSILPRFRAGDFAGGIQRGVDDIIQALSGDAAEFQRRAAERSPQGSEVSGQFLWVTLILGFWLISLLRKRNRRRAGWLAPFAIPMGGAWGGGRGGGFGQRGRSGFSGGGGSFGGGGASGRW